MKILLAKHRALGDTVFLNATAENIQAAYPEAEIFALVPEAFAPVLEGNPVIKKIFPYEAGAFALTMAFRKLNLNHFVQLHSSPSQRWLPLLSGAQKKHFSVQNNETEKAYGRHPNALEWDGFFLRTFLPRVQVQGPAPKIHLSEKEKAEGREYWIRQGADPSKLVFFGLGASRPTKRWPPAQFAELAELLRDRAGLQTALITGPGEVEERFAGAVLDQMRARGMRSISSKGDFVHGAGLNTRDLAKALSAVRAYVGNDSGPKHIAAAVGIPTFTFFGPEDPGEWHPYSQEQHPVFFLPGLKCRAEDNGRWCGIPVCVTEEHRCMVKLEAIDALVEVKRVLGI